MTAPSVTPVVVDTGVFGAPLGRSGHELAFRYRALLNGRHWAISFLTVAELRYGAALARWGQPRLARLEALVAKAGVVWPGPQLLQQYASLRAWCVENGHGLGQKDHEADRWVAATAMMLDIPLVANLTGPWVVERDPGDRSDLGVRRFDQRVPSGARLTFFLIEAPEQSVTEAVVFDCDGVLVDSEPLAWEAWRRVLAPYGVEVTKDDVSQLTGRTAHEAYTRFATRATLPTFAEVTRDVSAILFDLFDRGLRVFPDVPGTLSELRAKGVRLGVASSSPRRRLDHALAVAGISEFFDVSVAGDEVERGKPEPQLFTRAAVLLGIDPGACTAIEDSPAGVESANRAGMYVIAILRGSFTNTQLDSAHRILEVLDAASILGPVLAPGRANRESRDKFRR